MSEMHTDPATGRSFYQDPSTGQSRWADELAVQPPPAPLAVGTPIPAPALQRVAAFRFDGGAGGYLGINLLGFVITVVSLGLLKPLAVVMKYRRRAEHTMLDGRRLRFTGTATSLFGNWLKWWLLCVVTLGIYSLWVGPRLIKWVVEHQELAI